MKHVSIGLNARPRELLAVAVKVVPVSLALIAGAPGVARAGPDRPDVVSGRDSARVYNAGTADVTVKQFKQNAIINWHTFNVGSEERIRFDQPNSSSVILNRVTPGTGPSEILGRIDANGRVFIVNRDGFLFGAGSVINTAGFLATTSDIK